ncbi:uncharacterized protein LOC143449375 [Clavelina lepadiformis]|uniref:uncharacterized protein LOC143449375 n=1 Tax=Clavelina lepadiformis TaxID=159417 RepID=UPI0040412B47
MGNTVTAEQRDTNLSIAAEKGQVKEVGELLKKGADPNKRLADGERRHRTSLHRAAKTKNNVDVLTKLLNYIKDVDATDDDGNTALHLAAGYYNNSAVVQTLLHAKPNCQIQNNQEETALHSAVSNGSDWKVIELLLLADSDPNVPDYKGNTPLHVCASMRGYDAIITGMLLRFGANPNLKNEEGQTALHVAAKHGSKAVLLLLKFHAKVRLRDKEGKKASELAATDDIREILLHEEECLLERTVRVESISPRGTSQMDSPRRSTIYDVHNNVNNYYSHNGGMSPNNPETYFWADDLQQWRGYGGDGVIHLPDKSDIVIPPQAVPQGTSLKVKISRPRERESDDIPEFDFELYDFEFDIKVDLPGTLLLAPWMGESGPLTPLSPTSNQPPTFSGYCVEGGDRWKSLRHLGCQINGVPSLHFRLHKEKGQPMTYKIPLPTRRSTTEIKITRPILPNSSLNGHCDVTEILERDSSLHSESSLSSDDEIIDQENRIEKELEAQGEEDTESDHVEVSHNNDGADLSCAFQDDEPQDEEIANIQEQDRNVIQEEDHPDDAASHPHQDIDVGEDLTHSEDSIRYTHPIDPALETIIEDKGETPVVYSSSDSDDSITMDDVIDFKFASKKVDSD